VDDGLLAEVIAHPDDDGVRAVLADVLQADGDPRGELISLQLLASRGNRDRDDRIHELLHAHGRSWLSSLVEIADACRFDRGFPSRLALATEWPADDPRWAAVLRDPALATIEDLLPGSVRGDVYRRFLAGAKNLRRIQLFDRPSVEGFSECGALVEHVACTAFIDWIGVEYQTNQPYHRRQWAGESTGDATEDLDRLLDQIGERPSITSIGIPHLQVHALLRQRWYRRVRTLTIGGGNPRTQLARWDDLGQRHLVLVPQASLEPCERRFPWDYKVEIVPGEQTVAKISGEWMTMPTAVLEALPPEVTRVEIEHSSPVITNRMRDHVARPGVEVIEVPLRANNFVWEIR
jgi:uncharacterized protein (TIGR02996 family)